MPGARSSCRDPHMRHKGRPRAERSRPHDRQSQPTESSNGVAMEVKSTLRVIDQADVKARGGVTDGQTLKPIVGFADTPTDRIRIAVATYEAGTLEPLHWHPIE